jgi:hypothetical protein
VVVCVCVGGGGRGGPKREGDESFGEGGVQQVKEGESVDTGGASQILCERARFKSILF